MAGVLDTIPVSPSGWTDLAEVRLVGQRWLHRQRTQQSRAYRTALVAIVVRTTPAGPRATGWACAFTTTAPARWEA